ncbi:MAG TPA: NAD(P)H:quinone oxidoreductase [Planctomycetota bacterium]|nr:NAD(P)H:quinone oxidoreductase [Planctomycetota bacterium]
MQILIPFYSRYGNVAILAETIAKGALDVKGIEVKLAYCRDTFTPREIIERDKRWREMSDRLATKYPEPTLDDLRACAAMIQGSPTRFGNMAAPLKALWDASSSIWLEGSLAGKVGACFTATSSMHGGQETTLASMYFPMIHHGMIIVGLPYTEPKLATTTGGGSPYGPSAVVGPASDRPPTQDDLELAHALGKRVASITAKLQSASAG